MSFGSLCLLTIAAMSPTAALARANPSFLVQAEAVTLAPGSYLWDPLTAKSGPISMVVDLSSQRAFVYR